MHVTGSPGPAAFSRGPDLDAGADEVRRQAVRASARNTRAIAAVLQRETQDTCATARAIAADSLLLTHISVAFRTGAYTHRCGWCSRYLIGDRWMVVDRPRLIRPDRTTHGICGDCHVLLRETEQSV